MLSESSEVTMRTTIDIPEDLLDQVMSVSGARTKREAVCWALQQALRHSAIEDLLTHEVTIDFATTLEELKAREVADQYGKRQRRSSR